MGHTATLVVAMQRVRFASTSNETVETECALSSLQDVSVMMDGRLTGLVVVALFLCVHLTAALTLEAVLGLERSVSVMLDGMPLIVVVQCVILPV